MKKEIQSVPGSKFSPWPHFEEDEIAAVAGVLRSGKVNYWVGDEARCFEREYAAYTGTRYAIALMNGTVALDVCDVYVTFRRSLDSSLTWYERFWTNGVRAADTAVHNHAAHLATKLATPNIVQPQIQSHLTSSVPPQVIFTAGTVSGAAGKVVQVPITATIQGNYRLRLLLLNLSVVPLVGAPDLTAPVQFTQNATVLGAPYTTDSIGNGNYAAVWLNAGNAGVTDTVTLGTLSVTIPAGTPSGTAYGVFFDHASASPNGLASFPYQKITGTVLVQ